jgi:hypothetical protein
MTARKLIAEQFRDIPTAHTYATRYFRVEETAA